jgi:hypothetical protein
MKALISLSIILATSVVSAESLEERKYWKEQMVEVNDSIEWGEEHCGVKFEFEFVDKEKLRAELENTRWPPGKVCGVIVSEAVRLCREGDKPKAAVTAKIKSFRCGFAKERKMTLKNGVVTYMNNQTQPNPEQWAREQLLDNLPKSARVPGPH